MTTKNESDTVAQAPGQGLGFRKPRLSAMVLVAGVAAGGCHDRPRPNKNSYNVARGRSAKRPLDREPSPEDSPPRETRPRVVDRDLDFARGINSLGSMRPGRGKNVPASVRGPLNKIALEARVAANKALVAADKALAAAGRGPINQAALDARAAADKALAAADKAEAAATAYPEDVRIESERTEKRNRIRAILEEIKDAIGEAPV